MADAVVLVGVSLVTKPKPENELRGLVWGLKREEQEADDSVDGRRGVVPLAEGARRRAR